MKQRVSIRWEGGKATWAVFALLLLVGSLLYGNTLNVPWHFDDFRNIVENGSLKDPGARVGRVLESRGLTYLTLALNMAAGGLDTTGYHLVNIGVHILCAATVFFLLRGLFPATGAWPMIGALLFLAHPVQTQAVTYIVQRMASQSALFFMMSVLLYRRARAGEAGGAGPLSARFLAAYGGALACGVLAALSKENAVVLPAALLLLDLLLPTAGAVFNWRRDLPRLAPFLAIPALLVVQQLGGTGSTLHAVDRELSYRAEILGAARDGESLRGDGLWVRYLATEAIVFWKYVRLVFLPAGQRLVYAYPLVRSALNPSSLAATAGIVGLLAAAFWLRKREPRISFAILWVFLTLALESTLIPVDPMFEHRMYLPLVGFVVIGVDLLRRLPSRAALAAAGLALVLLSALTVRRNALWGDAVAFWEDNLRQVPDAVVVRISLAEQLVERGALDRAIALMLESAALAPGSEGIHYILGDAYQKKGLLTEARSSLEKAVEANPHAAPPSYLLGVVLASLGDHAAEVAAMERAVAADPSSAMYLVGLGLAHQSLGDLDKAEAVQRQACRIDPAYAKAHLDLGVTLYRKGNPREALEQFEAAMQLAPQDLTTLSNYASTALELGEVSKAEPVLRAIRNRDPKIYRELVGQLP